MYKFRAMKGKARRAISSMKRQDLERTEKNTNYDKEASFWDKQLHDHQELAVKAKRKAAKRKAPGGKGAKEAKEAKEAKLELPAVSAAKKSKKNMLSSFIEPEIREALVHKEVRNMRIAYLESVKDFVASAENFAADTDSAKILFKKGKGHMQQLKMLASDLMTTTDVQRPMFCLFTGTYGSKTWKSVIEHAVKKDMEKKKTTTKIFRPASGIDELIEMQKRRRRAKLNQKRKPQRD